MGRLGLIAAGMAISGLFMTSAWADAESDYLRETALKAKAGVPMSSEQLDTLYAGRSWNWGNGAGYFSKDGRRFSGWSQKGAYWSYAKGRWYTTDSGKVCMRALWFTKMNAAPDTTCFLHREKDGVIYQKPSLGGKWYVFKNNPSRADDEARKLRRGDLVQNHLQRLEALR
ncbi:DUF995 domain-containing protein [Chelativorans sp. M5D2P16]|uniref:DUF995 domain-containing protein n=1 Tax=Chelativorans sp. M5D2P16 TaxID=3095678 RepID=UPI002ACAF179|nr:DUF995 domain-containing protein [Chelativorans sp. M5D2P16]MDZ5699458.1 DUF995 domain-containing protein [Chelativorans sp. M5D2P16]